MIRLLNSQKVFILTLCFVLFVDAYSAKIFLIGDSTVSTYNSSYYPQAGWGQMLQYYFNSDSIIVYNRAIGGRSSKSFYNDHWSDVLPSIQAGDYVFVQFGINDANYNDTTRYAPPWTDFQDYLRLFVSETQAKGAACALVTTTRADDWSGATLLETRGDYPAATRAVAEEMGVPLIDLYAASGTLMQPLSGQYTGPFMYLRLAEGEYTNFLAGVNDHTHFQEMGAIEMAGLVVEEIKGLSDFEEMAKLIPSINPVHEVAVSSNMPDIAVVTRTASYPKDLTITLKTKPDLGYELKEWQDDHGNLVSTDNIYRYKVSNSDTSFYAILGEARDTITIQEDAKGFCNIDGIIDTNYSGYSGTGYARCDTAGAGIDWQIDIGLAGSYRFGWRYANGSGDRIGNLYINGSSVLSDVNFPNTDSWSNWDTVFVDVELTSGLQEVRLESVSDSGLANIDFFRVSGAVVYPVSCSGEQIISGAIYQVYNKASGKVLEIANASTTDGANVQQGTNSEGTHQQWQLDRVDTYYYTFKAMHSGKLMDIYGRRTTDGANAIQWSANGGTNQNWILDDMGDGWFKITARHSAKCLEVVDGSSTDGANVQQWTDNGEDAQRWKFVLVYDPTRIFADNESYPENIILEQNYPNPFNPLTMIRYQLPTAGMVELSIYNLLGQKVVTLVNEQQSAGDHSISWDASGFANGVYLYRLQCGSSSSVRKMILLK